MSILTAGLIGYAICVIAPVPWLSRTILDGWGKLWAKITSKA